MLCRTIRISLVLVCMLLLSHVAQAQSSKSREDQSSSNNASLYVRKDYRSLSDDEKRRFVEALLVLKSTPSKWKGYESYSVYDALVKIHVDAWFTLTVNEDEPRSSMYRNAAHRGPAFLPWHRYFLLMLESELRKVDDSVTIPYWDWTQEPSYTNSPVWVDDFLGGNGDSGDDDKVKNSKFLTPDKWVLKVGPNPDGSPNVSYLQRRFGEQKGPFGHINHTLPTRADIDQCLRLGAYDLAPWIGSPYIDSFRNRLEGWVTKAGDTRVGNYRIQHEGTQNHNRVHVWVGGSMRSPSSPNDPLFFLHHCYIDKLWGDWQASQLRSPQVKDREDLYQPRVNGPEGHSLRDSMQPFDRFVNIRPIDLLSHQELGYRYDTDPSDSQQLRTSDSWQWWWESQDDSPTSISPANARSQTTRSNSSDDIQSREAEQKSDGKRVRNPSPQAFPLRKSESNARSGGPISLTVSKSPNQIWNPTRNDYDHVNLRSYNNQLVGPVIRVRPGDLLRVHLTNELTDANNINDITNLHTHGLHVSPAGNSDNVFVHLEPGKSFFYDFVIPDDHPEGTFWYHAHVHGSTAVQVSSGVHGALIVEGGMDDLPELQNATEQIFVFQQIQYDENGEVEELSNFGRNTWEASGRYTSINGVVQPTIKMTAGEVQHWRFIHAGVREALHISLQRDESNQQVTLHEVALDGITTGLRNELQTVEMYPGYRVDVLVKAPEPGTYWLMDDESPNGRALLRDASTDEEERESRKTLAKIIVSEGTPRATELPSEESLASVVPEELRQDVFPGTAPEPTQFAEFNIDTSTTPTRFEINDEPFDPNRAPRRLILGESEVWKLSSRLGGHPFHIHVNPFQIERTVNGRTRKYWKDTIFVPSGELNAINIHTRYRRYIGKFVLHCHILDHEDQGMMEAIEITTPSMPGHDMGHSSRVTSDLELHDPDGHKVALSSVFDSPAIVIFFNGHDCIHCMEQLAEFSHNAASFRQLGIKLVAISNVSSEELSVSLDGYEHRNSFRFLADESKSAFEAFGCTETKHGLYFVAENDVTRIDVSDQPYLNVVHVLNSLASNQATASNAVSSRGTPTVYAEVRVRNLVTGKQGVGHGYWEGCTEQSKLNALNIATHYAASMAGCNSLVECFVERYDWACTDRRFRHESLPDSLQFDQLPAEENRSHLLNLEE